VMNGMLYHRIQIVMPCGIAIFLRNQDVIIMHRRCKSILKTLICDGSLISLQLKNLLWTFASDNISIGIIYGLAVDLSIIT